MQPSLTIYILRIDHDGVRAVIFARGDLPTTMDCVSVAFVTGPLSQAETGVVFACDFIAASPAGKLLGADRDLVRRRAGPGGEGSIDATGAIDGAALYASGLAAFRIDGDDAAALKTIEARFETLLALKRARQFAYPDWRQALSR